MSVVEPGPWHEDAEVWDTLVLGGKTFPGTAKVTVSRTNKWDKKGAKATSGAEQEYGGTEPAQVDIVVRIWTRTHYEAMRDCLDTIEPEEEKKRKDAIEIAHPTCAQRRVSFVVINSVAGPEEAGEGLWQYAIKATEHKPPTSKNASGKASGATGKYTTKCAQLAGESALETTNYVTANAAANAALKKLSSFEGSFGQNSSDAATYTAKAQAALAKMALIAAEQLALGCGEAAPSSKKKTTDP